MKLANAVAAMVLAATATVRTIAEIRRMVGSEGVNTAGLAGNRPGE
ncbi:MAG: hypothetical protein IPK85_06280 [Gemmatimonadetes bacterium]|nr:hypothetical protein [Gemmatimonadota bacterium]